MIVYLNINARSALPLCEDESPTFWRSPLIFPTVPSTPHFFVASRQIPRMSIYLRNREISLENYLFLQQYTLLLLRLCTSFLSLNLEVCKCILERSLHIVRFSEFCNVRSLGQHIPPCYYIFPSNHVAQSPICSYVLSGVQLDPIRL